MYSDSYNWFKGLPDPPKQNITPQTHRPIYREIAKDKQQAKEFVLKNPQDLFKVIDHEYDCMCACHECDCIPEKITFFDIVIKYKTLTEKDLLEIANTVTLDWFQISQKVPLSNDTVDKYKDQVDWKQVSSRSFYKKDEEFITRFHDKIYWEQVYTLNLPLSCQNIEELVFIKKYIPIKTAVKQRLLDTSIIGKYLPIIIKESEECLISSYEIDKLDNINVSLEDYMMQYKERFAEKCTNTCHISKKYLRVIMECSKNSISKFLNTCKPNETLLEPFMDNSKLIEIISQNQFKCSDQFIDKFIHILDIPEVLKWKMIDIRHVPEQYHNKYRAKLICNKIVTPEFIDQYADELDWFDVCEHQELPEWLLRKYIHKLNWGQVSAYQELSESFTKEFNNKLNWVKMNNNKKIKHNSMAQCVC